LHSLAENCNLDNPEEIKEFIATFDRKEGYKKNLVFAYDKCVGFYGVRMEKANIQNSLWAS